VTDKVVGFRILAMPHYKPGDLPPRGYLQWHEWAEVQRKAGIKQKECPTCGLWQTPQELSNHKVEWTLKDRKGHEFRQSALQCMKCFAKVSSP
jgi:hypothetical protein